MEADAIGTVYANGISCLREQQSGVIDGAGAASFWTLSLSEWLPWPYRAGVAAVAACNPIASFEGIEHNIPNQRGNRGNKKIRAREDIVQGERQTFPRSIGDSKLSHQEVGIEKKDDERDFNYCSTKLAEPRGLFGPHAWMNDTNPGDDRITRNSPFTLNPIYTDALPARVFGTETGAINGLGRRN